jgi:hypothetical protein
VEDQDVIFAFPLPIEFSADLYSVRVVAVGGFDLAYARIRFAEIPGRRATGEQQAR